MGDTPPAAEVEKEEDALEWSAFYDQNGNLYYYNNVSGESSWDAPDKFHPPPPPDDDDESPKDGTDTGGATETSKDESPKAADAAGDTHTTQQQQQQYGDWMTYKDEEGREYYYNTVTEETTWEKPDALSSEAAATAAAAGGGSGENESTTPPPSPEPNTTLNVDDEDDDDDDKPPSPKLEGETPPFETPQEDVAVDVAVEEEVEEADDVVDPAVKCVEDAEHALNEPDAIMEPGVMHNLTEVVTRDDGNPQKAIQALSDSYYGQAAACGLLGRWLVELKSQSTSSFSAVCVDEVRDISQGVINQISKERFTKGGGDRILDLSKSEAAFLEDMMDSNRWRKLLIDLSASNKDSALLMYCLQAISKRGHHREIARRINQSDHFSVFNGMLSSELSVIGKIAVTACNDQDSSISIDELAGNLERTCTSTAYTYIYAIEMLRNLVGKTKASAKTNDGKAESTAARFMKAVRKWERLSEDLQSLMIDPSGSMGGSTPLFRKRRLDVAVTISELHQRQRRRLKSPHGDETELPGEPNGREAKVESAVLNFLRRYSLGTRIDDRVLDAMLPDGLAGDKTNLIGNLLVKRPLSIKALLGYMYKPGSERGTSIVTKNKCARLLALAVVAAQQDAVSEANGLEGEENEPQADEVGLTRMLSEGSRLCETLENMVSFVVVAGSSAVNHIPTPGEQLCLLAFKCAPVALGAALWAREIVTGREFVSSASYPTLSPSILSLARVLFVRHPFVRDDVLEVAFEFLRHTSSEISYQKMNEIKEQSLRLLIVMVVKGEAPIVLGRITPMLSKAGSSVLDASLVRYLVAGLLQVSKPPFSLPYVRLFGGLLSAPTCVDAVKTSYFGEDSKTQLGKLIKYFQTLKEVQIFGKPLSREDNSLVKSLLAVYSE